ncbi:putative quinol monooxygenase [Alkalicoccobacillus plakortidis]|uniref:Antibiotic biosynthesis monooxygenase n=1 Tax=Alkalicoccobacillus plakortidis TaxID=444060 RepID=A0ABT0XNP4_9BACI|nr:putative quinol monooxygenase [Alkalicoccobacillus plakortidis]MCM2677524.1 antibiotic biosynthesis monooxygenase [Alkalicoccobacillus plakortidis]
MIITHVRFQIKPEQEQAFIQEATALITETRKETGNISYELVKNIEEEYTYTMMETWENEEATKLHNSSTHFTAFVQKAPEFLAGPIQAKGYVGEEVSL